MAISQVYKRDGSGEVGFNMTPMIDVTFQLIIFFILAGQMASAALSDLDVPAPHASQATSADDMKVERVIVNIPYAASGEDQDVNPAILGDARCYEIGGVAISLENTEALAEILRVRKAGARNKEKFFVEIRGDRRVNFGQVQPVLWAAAKAGISKMNITALLKFGD